MWKKITDFLQKKAKRSEERGDFKHEISQLRLEEEALKRIKRVNEIRAEVDKLILRRIKKRLPQDEERSSHPGRVDYDKLFKDAGVQ